MANLSFSVIIPTYQRREHASETVRALTSQSYKGALEILVIVDGSTDGTAAALAEINCRHPLRVIEQANAGAGAARNRGAREATGDILLFLDDDMTADPNMIAEHARSFNEGADAVVGDFTEGGSSRGVLSNILAKREAANQGSTLSPFDIFGGQISMHRSVFEKLGGFDESFDGNGDYGDFDVGRRLLDEFKLVHNPRALSHHRGVLSPGAHVRRARTCARATLHFARKHPELRDRLRDWTGADRISSRLRTLTSLPLVPQLLADAAAAAATVGGHGPGRSRLRGIGYTLAYWSTIHRLGGLDRS